MKFSRMPYERIDIPGAIAKIEELKRDLSSAKDGPAQFSVHQRYYQITDHVTTMSTLCEIRHDIDMSGEFYAAEQKYWDEQLPAWEQELVSYQELLRSSRFRPYLESLIGPVAFKNWDLAAQSVSPKILDLMQQESRLEDDYNRLIASAQIPWEGETKNLSQMSPYLHSPDRAVRVRAWKKYAAFFEQKEEQIEDIYDRLVKNRTQQGRLMGHENYLPLGYARMRRNCYGRSDLAQFREQVRRDWVPFCTRLHRARAQRLHLSRLSLIDEGVYFPDRAPAPVGNPAQILAAGRRMYHALSPETGKFMDRMCEGELFDVAGRKNKRAGGYMTFLPDYQAPFIFANFNGSSDDADVITHECGHAFQGWLAAQDSIREHADITMETAETHSMSMEFFTEPWMDLLFQDAADDYRLAHLLDSILFIPYGTMLDEFQDIVYDNPGFSPKERNQVWLDLERQYRPHLDYSDCPFYERGTFWQNKPHPFDVPLYYIDYCLAQTNALQYKLWMQRDFSGAWESYLRLCRLSASDTFDHLCDRVGLIIPFEDGCLGYLARKLGEKLL